MSLDVAALAGLPLGPVRWVAETGSTNADLLGADGPAGEVLVADHQTAGRGRLDRSWEEPAGSSVMFSVRLQPTAPGARWGWLPLLAGVALAEAVGATAPGLAVGLKWPNDVLVGPDLRKVAGILAEARGPVVVIGCGLNVTQDRDALPVPTATSLAAEGVADVDRTALLRAVLEELGGRFAAWDRADGDPDRSGLLEAYSARCVTLGREVEVTRARDVLHGRAVRITADAGLVVAGPDGETVVLAGDVTHVRPAG